MQQQDKVRFFKTPDSVLTKQLESYDDLMKKYQSTNPLFKEIITSQIEFARRATRWEQDYITNRKMAVDYYFGPNGKTPI
jgi:TRAP-type mannitol/chloroaromatic compound transport system substrate-binding protein